MFDDDEVPVRDPRSAVFEAEYWMHALDDIRTLNERILSAAQAVSSVPIEVLALLMGDEKQRPAERIGAATHATLDELAAMQEPLDRLVALAGGRINAIRNEAGLPPSAEPFS